MRLFKVQWWSGWGAESIERCFFVRAPEIADVREQIGRKYWASKSPYVVLSNDGKEDRSPVAFGGPEITIDEVCDYADILDLHELPQPAGSEEGDPLW